MFTLVIHLLLWLRLYVEGGTSFLEITDCCVEKKGVYIFAFHPKNPDDCLSSRMWDPVQK